MPFLPFIPFLDCAEVVIQMTQQAIPWFLTSGWKFSTAVTLADLVALAGGIDTWITNELAPLISSNVNIVGIKVTGLTSAVDPTFVATPTTTTGSLAGTVLSAQAAMVVTFATALRGRSYRGRNYVAGRVTGELLTVTQWNNAPVAAMGEAYQDLPDTMGPLGWTHVVLSRQNNNVRRTVGVATPVTSWTAKAQIATQRKRLF